MRKRQRVETVILIEDSPVHAITLSAALTDDGYRVKVFKDPDDFAENFKDVGNINHVAAIVVDFHFDSYDAQDKDIVTYLRRNLGFNGKIIAWSLDDSLPPSFRQGCDFILPKKIFKLSQLLRGKDVPINDSQYEKSST
jgi:hypothetical protein